MCPRDPIPCKSGCTSRAKIRGTKGTDFYAQVCLARGEVSDICYMKALAARQSCSRGADVTAALRGAGQPCFGRGISGGTQNSPITAIDPAMPCHRNTQLSRPSSLSTCWLILNACSREPKRSSITSQWTGGESCGPMTMAASVPRLVQMARLAFLRMGHIQTS